MTELMEKICGIFKGKKARGIVPIGRMYVAYYTD
jgi:hypothetical protein